MRRSPHAVVAQSTAVETPSTGSTSGRIAGHICCVGTPVLALTVNSSGAPGLSSSPPTDAPSRSAAPTVTGENPAARISGTTTVPRHTAVLVWLMTGTFTTNPTSTTPGTISGRTRRIGRTSSRTRWRSQPVCFRT